MPDRSHDEPREFVRLMEESEALRRESEALAQAVAAFRRKLATLYARGQLRDRRGRTRPSDEEFHSRSQTSN